MANLTYLEVLAIETAEVAAKLEVVNKAITEKKLDDYTSAMSALSDSLANYNIASRNVDFERLAATENPMIEAVKQFYVTVAKPKEVKDKITGDITKVVVESKPARIDLEKFCDFAELNIQWAYDSCKLLDLLVLRETDVFAMKPSDLEKKSYYFIANANKKKSGETPDSNTKITKMLQKIIDEAIFIDDGEGKNVYKVTNHDIAFIQDCVAKLDAKEKCAIVMVNQRQFKNIMMSVFAHILGEAYKVKAAKAKKKG